MLAVALHLRGQELSLRDIAARAALSDCKALKMNPAAGTELRVPKRKPLVWTPERVIRWRESGGKCGATYVIGPLDAAGQPSRPAR